MWPEVWGCGLKGCGLRCGGVAGGVGVGPEVWGWGWKCGGVARVRCVE